MARSIPRTKPRAVELQLPRTWGVNWFAFEPTPLGSIWAAVYHPDGSVDPTVGVAIERDGSVSARFEQPVGGMWAAVSAGRPVPLADGGAAFVAEMRGTKTHYRWFQVDHTGRVVNERDLFVDSERKQGSGTPYVYPLEDSARMLVTWRAHTCLVEVATGEVLWRIPGSLYEGAGSYLLFADVRPARGTVHRVSDGARHRELTFDGDGWLRVWARYDRAVVNRDPEDEGYELDVPAGYVSQPTRKMSAIVVDLESGREVLRAPGRITALDPRAPVLVVTEWTKTGTVERRFLHDGTLLAEVAHDGSMINGAIGPIDDVVLLRRTRDSIACEMPGSPPEVLWRMPIPPATNEDSRAITCVGGTLFVRDDYSQRITMYVEPRD